MSGEPRRPRRQYSMGQPS